MERYACGHIAKLPDQAYNKDRKSPHFYGNVAHIYKGGAGDEKKIISGRFDVVVGLWIHYYGLCRRRSGIAGSGDKPEH